MQRDHCVSRGALRSRRLRTVAAAAAGAMALLLMPRAPSACSCATRAAHLMFPPAEGATSATRSLLVRAPTDADIHIEDAAGRPMPARVLLQLAKLGLCEMPWFLVTADGEPWPAGQYRLVRGPDAADDFTLTAAGVSHAAAALVVAASVETHDPITPSGSLCADPKIGGRAFSRTAHVSFAFSAPALAGPVFATAAIPDPQTPGGLANSVAIHSVEAGYGDIPIDLPIEDGADPCVTVTVWDEAGTVLLADTLCTAAAPQVRSATVSAIVPAGSALVPRGIGCSVASEPQQPRPGFPLGVLGLLGYLAWPILRTRR